MASELSVYLGSIGWEHAAWQGVFYPDDLPEDWRLAYYNTQFSAVFLPYADWSTANDERWRQWLDDCQRRFRFVLESGPPPAAIEDTVALLGERLGMITDRNDPRLLWFDAGTDLQWLAGEIERRTKPLYLFSLDADLKALQRVQTLLELMGC